MKSFVCRDLAEMLFIVFLVNLIPFLVAVSYKFIELLHEVKLLTPCCVLLILPLVCAFLCFAPAWTVLQLAIAVSKSVKEVLMMPDKLIVLRKETRQTVAAK